MDRPRNTEPGNACVCLPLTDGRSSCAHSRQRPRPGKPQPHHAQRARALPEARRTAPVLAWSPTTSQRWASATLTIECRKQCSMRGHEARAEQPPRRPSRRRAGNRTHRRADRHRDRHRPRPGTQAMARPRSAPLGHGDRPLRGQETRYEIAGENISISTRQAALDMAVQQEHRGKGSRLGCQASPPFIRTHRRAICTQAAPAAHEPTQPK
jgi:hypothetical protein